MKSTLEIEVVERGEKSNGCGDGPAEECVGTKRVESHQICQIGEGIERNGPWNIMRMLRTISNQR